MRKITFVKLIHREWKDDSKLFDDGHADWFCGKMVFLSASVFASRNVKDVAKI